MTPPPDDIDALVARLQEYNYDRKVRGNPQMPILNGAADALVRQKDRIAELEDTAKVLQANLSALEKTAADAILRLAAVEAERDTAVATANEEIARAEQAEAERDRMRLLFREYGWHHVTCALLNRQPDCDCGFRGN